MCASRGEDLCLDQRLLEKEAAVRCNQAHSWSKSGCAKHIIILDESL